MTPKGELFVYTQIIGLVSNRAIRTINRAYYTLELLELINRAITFGFIFSYIFISIKPNGNRYIFTWIHDMSKVVKYS